MEQKVLWHWIVHLVSLLYPSRSLFGSTINDQCFDENAVVNVYNMVLQQDPQVGIASTQQPEKMLCLASRWQTMKSSTALDGKEILPLVIVKHDWITRG